MSCKLSRASLIDELRKRGINVRDVKRSDGNRGVPLMSDLKRALAEAPLKSATKGNKSVAFNSECPICLCEGDGMHVLNCGHAFHLDCCKGLSKMICPMCNAKITNLPSQLCSAIAKNKDKYKKQDLLNQQLEELGASSSSESESESSSYESESSSYESDVSSDDFLNINITVIDDSFSSRINKYVARQMRLAGF